MNPNIFSILLVADYRLPRTIDRITTQGRFKEETILTANEVFPEPELPAIPMMLVSAHGGE
jgi:hypothetical protein